MPSYNNIGKYKRNKLLGAGNFGEVYEVYDQALQTTRALKIIKSTNPSTLIEKLNEARILEICKHKHVVEVKEADIKKINGENCVIITTELMHNSAENKLKTGFLRISETIDIIRDALFGLEHLHVNNVVHWDIKPGNILLTAKGVAKLSDFGLSIRIKLGEVPKKTYTLHTAPESISNLSNASPLSDIYSMGVTMYRLVNNISNFRAIAPKNPKIEISKGNFPERNQYKTYVSTKLKRICNKAMNIDPLKRYQSASKFGQALDKINTDIDWIQIKPLEWEGKNNNNIDYKIIGIPNKTGWQIEFIRNGRRVTKYCKKHLKDNWVTENEIQSIIASTSIL